MELDEQEEEEDDVILVEPPIGVYTEWCARLPSVRIASCVNLPITNAWHTDEPGQVLFRGHSGHFAIPFPASTGPITEQRNDE